MTLEEKLMELAHTHNTMVYEHPLPLTSSVSAKLDDVSYIGIDTQKLDGADKRAVHLAHELGHCETDSFYSIYSPLVTRDKLERRANVWAIEHTIPIGRLNALIKEGVREVWELAERFEVTVEFMHAALEYYRCGEVHFDIQNIK